ncbi:hypothetical protein Scep_004258 [Stephania cephalantha]|uniref:Uncharacterized protein n=1 Tax=Stephania cephalantha TaxID=152367 RepID=A0AAP0KTQ3_9MAGN
MHLLSLAELRSAQPIGLDFTVQGRYAVIEGLSDSGMLRFLDENRYSVSRRAHRNLKRAERARIAVNKIPALVDSLIAKTRSWEDERRKVFLYDEFATNKTDGKSRSTEAHKIDIQKNPGFPVKRQVSLEVPLLAMLEEYNLSRQEKEEEKQRQRVEDEPVGEGKMCEIEVPRARPHDRERSTAKKTNDWGRGRGRQRNRTTAREHGEEDEPVGGGEGRARPRERKRERESTAKKTIQGVGEHDRERIRERESKPIQRGKKNQAVGEEE